jgi:hypothetical protein
MTGSDIEDRTEDGHAPDGHAPGRGLNRRSLLRGVFLAGGVAAAATAGGAATRVYDTAQSSGPGGRSVGNQTLTEDFFGLTTDGRLIDGLYPIRSDGVDTAPVIAAAQAFLTALSDDQKQKTQFPVRSTEWRMWSNLDPGGYARQGVSLADLTDTQQNLGRAMMRAALSAEGLDTADRIRRINLAAGQAVGKSDTFNDLLYYFTVMGTPSATEPWGFQFDGHHLVVNYFVLGDQVVMSPCFWGTEPTSMQIGGESVTACQEEVAASLAFIQSLTPSQQQAAVISPTKDDEDMQAGAFADNAVEAYAGIPAAELSDAQQEQLLAVAQVFAGRAKDDVAAVRMAEIRRHLDDTHAAWIGSTGTNDPFYLRIHSPVVWIEVDCQAAGPLGGAYGKTRSDGPTQMHIHSVARTPNGNDYGRDLLRQHYLTSPHHQ